MLGLSAKEWDPWTPQDSMAIMKMMELSLTWDWTQDWVREVLKLESPELEKIAEIIVPFTQEYMKEMVTAIDDDDLKKMGQWSEKTLNQRYHENYEHLRSAEPKRNHEAKKSTKNHQDKLSDAEKAKIVMDLGSSGHSNNWVIHGKHTESGMPMLANDPHLGTSIPCIW